MSRLALALPAMPDRDYQALREDIRKNGQVDPIVVLNGEMVDGDGILATSHRARHELGIKPKYAILRDDKDQLAYVLSNNRHRRSMNPSQTAIVSGRTYLLKREGPDSLAQLQWR